MTGFGSSHDVALQLKRALSLWAVATCKFLVDGHAIKSNLTSASILTL